MSLVTRCPNCDTTFRVSLPQLQAHRGDVRCGRCAQVFDAFADLSTVQDEAAEMRALEIAEAEVEMEEQPHDDIAAGRFDDDYESAPVAGDAGDADSFKSDFDTDHCSTFDGGQSNTAAAPPLAQTSNNLATPAYQPLGAYSERDEFQPFFEEENEGRGVRITRATWLWLGGSLLLLIALLIQAGYVFRSDLAVRYPGLKPPLQSLCRVLGCAIPLPQEWEKWTVESSDLKSLDERPGRVELSASLRNRARYSLAYPALDLTLTNVRDEAIARRIFMPKEYLPATTDFAAGLPGNGDLAVRLVLDTTDLNASGYRLFVLYP